MGVAHDLCFNEVIERGYDPPPRVASVIWVQRYSRGLEPSLIVALEAASYRIYRESVAEIRRDIGDTDFVVAVAFAAP